jgi:hypothetical protein
LGIERMRYFISSILCLLIGVTVGWFMVHSRVETEVDANMMRVVIMGVTTGNGHEETYTESGLRDIAEQYLREHHVTVRRDDLGLIVHMKSMDVDSHPIFATVVFGRGDLARHAVDIGTDGTAIREYAIEPAKVLMPNKHLQPTPQ